MTDRFEQVVADMVRFVGHKPTSDSAPDYEIDFSAFALKFENLYENLTDDDKVELLQRCLDRFNRRRP